MTKVITSNCVANKVHGYLTRVLKAHHDAGDASPNDPEVLYSVAAGLRKLADEFDEKGTKHEAVYMKTGTWPGDKR